MNQHLNWRWTFHVQIIWSFIQAVVIILVSDVLVAFVVALSASVEVCARDLCPCDPQVEGATVGSSLKGALRYTKSTNAVFERVPVILNGTHQSKENHASV
jgi:hypothetical protein